MHKVIRIMQILKMFFLKYAGRDLPSKNPPFFLGLSTLDFEINWNLDGSSAWKANLLLSLLRSATVLGRFKIMLCVRFYNFLFLFSSKLWLCLLWKLGILLENKLVIGNIKKLAFISLYINNNEKKNETLA